MSLIHLLLCIFEAEVKMIMNFAINIQKFQLPRYLNEIGQNVFMAP